MKKQTAPKKNYSITLTFDSIDEKKSAVEFMTRGGRKSAPYLLYELRTAMKQEKQIVSGSTNIDVDMIRRNLQAQG